MTATTDNAWPTHKGKARRRQAQRVNKRQHPPGALQSFPAHGRKTPPPLTSEATCLGYVTSDEYRCKQRTLAMLRNGPVT
jgi:hypothetical protein